MLLFFTEQIFGIICAKGPYGNHTELCWGRLILIPLMKFIKCTPIFRPMPSVLRLCMQESMAKVYFKLFNSYTEHVATQSGFKIW